jgi:enterochelin esterase-like enzyme
VLLAAPSDRMTAHPLYVYLPPGYDRLANRWRRYPVVYLLHGMPGSAVDWLRAGALSTTMETLLADHLVRPMIVAMPSAGTTWGQDSECLDAVGGFKVESYLTHAVVAYVDRHYRTVANRSGRAVGGMSSGAYCALNLGLRHTDEFSVILSHEGYGTPGRQAEVALLRGSAALYRANSPALYLPTMRFQQPMAVFLDAGSNDRGVLAEAHRLGVELADKGQTVAFRVAEGSSHSWREARAELPYSLVFASRFLLGGKPAPGS